MRWAIWLLCFFVFAVWVITTMNIEDEKNPRLFVKILNKVSAFLILFVNGAGMLFAILLVIAAVIGTIVILGADFLGIELNIYP
ncbi:hypothetical protein SAMN02745751_03172 [Dethiosulfatibacter aminovorans DSM 17477]|uniref:Uncharacterized protein n=1 Tax=Dethiosulfatibacter aminovorans DSM 17477 TaxID=1121476 RepID=A0A1M6LH73_9FIRM|nr:hypothetical protein [Dethiosulfatibacter aminovorans]SHJ70498.1 hypothetical protein SAMN02745751_03172 [Dethiosulfatibacter aminovorans DSM 17477]